MTQDLAQLCTTACDLVKQAGTFIRNEAAGFKAAAVEEKSFNQLVSYVDETAEKMLVTGLSELLPEAGFITEEATIATDKKEYMWVIDPLDGTTNFIHGLPVYSVSVGLMHQDKTIMGIVYEINRDELFYAWQNSPAYLNGKIIRVKQEGELRNTLLATGFPYYDFDIMQQYLNTLNELMKTTRGMRRMGSAAVDLAYVACGRFDGFFEYGLNAWDVCGGAFIVQQAGGIVTDFRGSDDYIFGKTIVAGSSSIHNPLLNVVQQHFEK
jgi:myo-inositol-1(or 4)-monophosphatase